MVFKKPDVSRSQVINDINVDLVTLYRVVQNHLDEFVRYFRWALVARDEFARLHLVDATTLTDIQRAARALRYMDSTTFGISTSGGPHLLRFLLSR